MKNLVTILNAIAIVLATLGAPIDSRADSPCPAGCGCGGWNADGTCAGCLPTTSGFGNSQPADPVDCNPDNNNASTASSWTSGGSSGSDSGSSGGGSGAVAHINVCFRYKWTNQRAPKEGLGFEVWRVGPDNTPLTEDDILLESRLDGPYTNVESRCGSTPNPGDNGLANPASLGTLYVKGIKNATIPYADGSDLKLKITFYDYSDLFTLSANETKVADITLEKVYDAYECESCGTSESGSNSWTDYVQPAGNQYKIFVVYGLNPVAPVYLSGNQIKTNALGDKATVKSVNTQAMPGGYGNLTTTTTSDTGTLGFITATKSAKIKCVYRAVKVFQIPDETPRVWAKCETDPHVAGHVVVNKNTKPADGPSATLFINTCKFFKEEPAP